MNKLKTVLAIFIAALMLSQLVGTLPVSAAASNAIDASPIYREDEPKTVVLICDMNGKSAGFFPQHALPGKTNSGNFFAFKGLIEEGDDYSAKCAEQLETLIAEVEAIGGTLSKDPKTGVLVIVLPAVIPDAEAVLPIFDAADSDLKTFESNSNLLEKDVVSNPVAIAQNPNLNGGLTGQDKKDAVDVIVDNGSDKTDEWCAAHPNSNNCK